MVGPLDLRKVQKEAVYTKTDMGIDKGQLMVYPQSSTVLPS